MAHPERVPVIISQNGTADLVTAERCRGPWLAHWAFPVPKNPEASRASHAAESSVAIRRVPAAHDAEQPQ